MESISSKDGLANQPFLTVLNYSAGRQSHHMLERYLRGEASIPKRFMVVNANPGMEKQSTRKLIAESKARCERAGILFVEAPGPNLYRDFVENRYDTRADNPPLWTKNDTGSRGQLIHKCTKAYKIIPMRRAIRKALESTRFWGSIQAKGSVHCQVCFSADEERRLASVDSNPAWQVCVYPMMDEGITDDDIAADYRRWGMEYPDPSLCNGCPFHGLRSRKQQTDQDWHEALTFDEAIRDLTALGIERPCYTSDTLIPLRDLGESGFDLGSAKENDLHSCSSGVCFI